MVSRVESRAWVCLLACSGEYGRSSQSWRSASQSSAKVSTYAAQRSPCPAPKASSTAAICAPRLPPGRSRTMSSSGKRCWRIGSTGTSSTSFSSARPDLRNRSRITAGSSVLVGPESQRKPSCSTYPTAPPSRSLPSSRVTSWPSLARRAALARPPYPPPITTTRAMAATLGRGCWFPRAPGETAAGRPILRPTASSSARQPRPQCPVRPRSLRVVRRRPASPRRARSRWCRRRG